MNEKKQSSELMSLAQVHDQSNQPSGGDAFPEKIQTPNLDEQMAQAGIPARDDCLSQNSPRDRRNMFFNKRNHSSKFNELKILIDSNIEQNVKPQTSHANEHYDAHNSPFKKDLEEVQKKQAADSKQFRVKKRPKKTTLPLNYGFWSPVKEKKTVSFKFSPN